MIGSFNNKSINSQIEKSHILLEQVHTSNTSNLVDDNKITFQFQFILVDTSDKYTGNYYLTAGVEYGNQAYVWVGQAAITTAYQVRVRLSCQLHISYKSCSFSL